MSPNKADETTYLWENIPRELWNAARSRALRERRPMKDVLKELLVNWMATPEGASHISKP